jgi:beta-glucosidase
LGTTALYDLAFRVASPVAGGKFHAEIDGVNVTGALAVPNTGNFQTFQTVTKSGVNINAGQHTLRLFLDAVGSNGSVGNFNWLKIGPPQFTAATAAPPPPPPPPPPPTQTPFSGTPINIPASGTTTIQTENFDNGGEGIAFHDIDAANNGGQYRTTAVDIETTGDTGGGFHVGYTAPASGLSTPSTSRRRAPTRSTSACRTRV